MHVRHAIKCELFGMLGEAIEDYEKALEVLDQTGISDSKRKEYKSRVDRLYRKVSANPSLGVLTHKDVDNIEGQPAEVGMPEGVPTMDEVELVVRGSRYATMAVTSDDNEQYKRAFIGYMIARNFFIEACLRDIHVSTIISLKKRARSYNRRAVEIANAYAQSTT